MYDQVSNNVIVQLMIYTIYIHSLVCLVSQTQFENHQGKLCKVTVLGRLSWDNVTGKEIFMRFERQNRLFWEDSQFLILRKSEKLSIIKSNSPTEDPLTATLGSMRVE